MELSDFDSVMQVAFRAPTILVKEIVPAMIKNGSGAVVNIASGAGLRGLPGSSAYAAAKAALINFTKTTGEEVLRQGVRVNCVCPGPIELAPGYGTSEQLRKNDTDLIKAKTVANMVLYLASDMSKGVNCQVITVRGANRW